MRTPILVFLMVAVLVSAGCSADWDDDHLVLNRLVLPLDEDEGFSLDESRSTSAQKESCRLDCPPPSRDLAFDFDGDPLAASDAAAALMDMEWKTVVVQGTEIYFEHRTIAETSTGRLFARLTLIPQSRQILVRLSTSDQFFPEGLEFG